MKTTTLHIAIPAMDEFDFLPQIIADLKSQQCSFQVKVYICVNQPDSWWSNSEKSEVDHQRICANNAKTLQYLRQFENDNFQVIDKSSKGKGWTDKKYGVGWARKTLFDAILKFADEEDVIVSLDADTRINPRYLDSLGANFIRNNIPVLSVPYYHNLTSDDRANRAILRYEIYMRNYLINMFRIHSPYAFTAIGSAIAVRVKALRKIGGITPAKSGEDFYLLQKLRKMTTIANDNQEWVYPAARFSSRVFFGTGPAMIKGNTGNWSSYPIYHFSLFDKLNETYSIVNELFTKDIETDFLVFLQKQYSDNDLWQPLRKNAKDFPHFLHAFHEKADALRILQYLKTLNAQMNISDTQSLFDNLNLFFAHHIPDFVHPDRSLDDMRTEQLQIIRNQLVKKENVLRKTN